MNTRQYLPITEQWQKVLITIFILLLLWAVRDVLVLLLLALTIAAAVSPLVNTLVRWHWRRALAVVFIYFILLLIIVLFLFLVIPSVAAQLREIAAQIPAIYNRFLGLFHSLEQLLEKSRLIESPEQFLNQINESLLGSASSLLFSTFTLMKVIASLVVVLVISFYLVASENAFEEFWRAVVPLRYEEYVSNLWQRVNKKIGRWLQGQLLLGLIVGVMTYLGLKIFSMHFTFTLALIAGIFELVPFVGPIISAVPAVILGFAHSTSLGLMMILLYLAIQQLENHLIVPLVTNKLVGLNPVIVILALIAGGSLAGFVGVLVAVPVTVIITEIFNDFAARKQVDKSLAA